MPKRKIKKQKTGRAKAGVRIKERTGPGGIVIIGVSGSRGSDKALGS
jgi:hypothetical protein